MILEKASIGCVTLALALSPALAQATPVAKGKSEGPSAQAHGKGTTQRSESGDQHAGGAEHHGQQSGQGKGEGGANSGHEGGANPGHEGKTNPGHEGSSKPRACKIRDVAYVASGKLVSDSLAKSEANDTYSGQLTVEVKRTNRHANAARGQTETYTVQAAHVRGPLGVAALAAGDRTKLIGKITASGPRCESSSFTPVITIRTLVFHR